MSKDTNNILLFGAHMSISGGLDTAITRGESIGCTAIQIFTKSNRQWHAKEITDHEASLFKEKFKNSTIKSVIVHASYLINIGSANSEINKKSLEALIMEINRCEKLGLKYLILHPGSRQGSTEEFCIDLIATNINKAFEATPNKVTILLENSAGSGTHVAYSFEQISQIIEKINNKSRISVCFDTCHAFSAGYNFSNVKEYHEMWSKFDKIIGLKYLHAIHINDSKKELGSRVDRHANIGKGKIGLEAFRLLFNDHKFFDIPKVLETPTTENDPIEYLPDIREILNLIKNTNFKECLNK